MRRQSKRQTSKDIHVLRKIGNHEWFAKILHWPPKSNLTVCAVYYEYCVNNRYIGCMVDRQLLNHLCCANDLVIIKPLHSTAKNNKYTLFNRNRIRYYVHRKKNV